MTAIILPLALADAIIVAVVIVQLAHLIPVLR